MSFDNFADFFKQNRELLDDDWNDGKLYVAKLKTKAKGVDFATTMKVSQPGTKDNKHTVGCEQKLKVVVDFLGELETEMKFASAGANCWTTHIKTDWDVLKHFNEDLAGNKVLFRGNYGTINADGTPKHQPLSIGHSYENDTQGVKFEHLYTAEKDTKQKIEMAIQRNSWLFGGSVDRKLLETAGYKGQFAARWTAPDGQIRSGFLAKVADKDKKPQLSNFDWFFTAKTQWGAAGASFLYDHVNWKGTSHVGAQVVNADHTWKFRLNSNGMARAALQWNIHPSTKATLNSKVMMADFVAGKVDSLPLGLSLEVKY